MPVRFVTGGTGSGKGTYSIIEIKRYLDEGKRVATNVDLFLDELTDSDSDNSPMRLPDVPNAEHFKMLGYGSDKSNKNKNDYGLIVLDEISIFLDSKRGKEYKELMKWLTQRRKFHWDIIFICQSKDQVEDTVYKSLCDNLVVCSADDLIPIPYFSGVLGFFGFKGMLPEAHTAFTFNGRAETGSIIKTESYKNHPYREMYDTDQVFGDDLEYVEGRGVVDMRAVYTYLPSNILTKTKFIDFYTNQLKKLQRNNSVEEGEDMAKTKADPSSKIKIFLLVGAVVVFFFFKNPMDNPLLANQDEVPESPVVSDSVSSYGVNVGSDPIIIREDFIISLFSEYRPRLSAYMTSPDMGVICIIDFYEGGQIVERLTLQDFHDFGYTIVPAGSGVFVVGDGFKKRVTSYPLKSMSNISSENSGIASRLSSY